jgi:transcriptional regulator with XRE-family HTH domain
MLLKDKIVILRKARGYSQQELGDRLSKATFGVSRQAVHDWESGKSEPKLDKIRDLANILNVSYDVLLDETVDLNDQEVLASVLNGSYSKKNKSNNDIFLNMEIYHSFYWWKILFSFLIAVAIGLFLFETITYAGKVKVATIEDQTTIMGKLDAIIAAMGVTNESLIAVFSFSILLCVFIIVLVLLLIGLFATPYKKKLGYMNGRAIVLTKPHLSYYPLDNIASVEYQGNPFFSKLILKGKNGGQTVYKNVYHGKDIAYLFNDLQKLN